jgi:hypothetical protein
LISSGTAKRSACILLGINEKRKVRMWGQRKLEFQITEP